VIGGFGSTEDLTSIERASLAGGTLGPFQTDSNHLLISRDASATAVSADFVYVIGGSDSGTLVEVAPILADGTLGPFGFANGQLVTSRSDAAAVVLGTTLYVIGGFNNNSSLDSVEAAPIRADGTLGPFTTLSNVTLQIARWGLSADVVGNSIYVVGGYSDQLGGKYVTSVERATLQ
jgi:hypothetical protein